MSKYKIKNEPLKQQMFEDYMSGHKNKVDLSKKKMIYFERIQLSLKLWRWLFENPGKEKRDSPYMGKIYRMLAKCPLCDHHDLNCEKCILFKKQVCTPCNDSTYAYWAWCNNKYNTVASGKIVKILTEEYDRLLSKQDHNFCMTIKEVGSVILTIIVLILTWPWLLLWYERLKRKNRKGKNGAIVIMALGNKEKTS